MKESSKINSITAFIDILGFKEIVKANKKSKDNLIFHQLNEALDEAHNKAILLTKQSLVLLRPLYNEDFESRLNYKQFSDNLFLSFDYREDKSDYIIAVYFVTFMAAYYQRILLSNGFYVRGGISDGENFIANHMIFSSALIKAYELEAKVAKYPRIVIDNKIVNVINKISKENIFTIAFTNFIVKDWNGVLFLNPFCIEESLNNMFNEMPEIITTISFLKNQQATVGNSNDANHKQDISDEQLCDKVYDDLKRKMKKHRMNLEIYEKYRWLNEFLRWQENEESGYSYLMFRYY